MTYPDPGMDAAQKGFSMSVLQGEDGVFRDQAIPEATMAEHAGVALEDNSESDEPIGKESQAEIVSKRNPKWRDPNAMPYWPAHEASISGVGSPVAGPAFRKGFGPEFQMRLVRASKATPEDIRTAASQRKAADVQERLFALHGQPDGSIDLPLRQSA